MTTEGSLEFQRSVGTVAAFLTGYELIVSTVLGACLGPLLYGLWLARLHSTRKVTLRKSQLRFRLLRRELIGLTLAIVLSISLALVENSLNSGLRLSAKETASLNTCVRLDGFYNFSTISILPPPFHFIVDQWSHTIALQLNCPRGLLTVEFGDETEGTAGSSTSAAAPICIRAPVITDPGFPGIDAGAADMRDAHFTEWGIQMGVPVVSLLPYSGTLGRSRDRINDEDEQYSMIPECEQLGIASIPLRFYRSWDVSGFDDYNMSRVILSRMCAKANTSNQLPTTVPLSSVSDCWNNISLKVDCVASRASAPHHASVDLPHTSLLIGQDVQGRISNLLSGVDDAVKSVACPNATVRVHYMLIPSNDVFAHFNRKPFNGFKWATFPRKRLIMVPTRIEKIDGPCEPTIHMLGLGALIRSAYAEWTNSPLAEMDRQVRYQMYVMSLARYYYPLSEFQMRNKSTQKSTDTEYPCTLRRINNTTLMQRNWMFWVLVSISSVIFAIVAAVVIFLSVFPKRAWEICPLETLQRYNPIECSFAQGHHIVLDHEYERRKKISKLSADIEKAEKETERDPELTVLVEQDKDRMESGWLHRVLHCRAVAYHIKASQVLP